MYDDGDSADNLRNVDGEAYTQDETVRFCVKKGKSRKIPVSDMSARANQDSLQIEDKLWEKSNDGGKTMKPLRLQAAIEPWWQSFQHKRANDSNESQL